VESGGLRGAVGEGGVLTERADTDTCDRGCYDYAGGIAEGGVFAEERRESVVGVSYRNG
jgi:hypothetical protein